MSDLHHDTVQRIARMATARAQFYERRSREARSRAVSARDPLISGHYDTSACERQYAAEALRVFAEIISDMVKA